MHLAEQFRSPTINGTQTGAVWIWSHVIPQAFKVDIAVSLLDDLVIWTQKMMALIW